MQFFITSDYRTYNRGTKIYYSFMIRCKLFKKYLYLDYPVIFENEKIRNLLMCIRNWIERKKINIIGFFKFKKNDLGFYKKFS